jgi:hypothetical protein
MKNIEAVRYKHRLDALFKKAKEITDLEIQAHWSRYLCILVSGFLEVSIPAIFADYAKNKSSPNVYNFVAKRLDLSPLKMEGILQLTFSFSKKWGEKLDKETQDGIKDSINSIFANRNLLAHGSDTGISYQMISSWYKDAVKLLDKLESICESG